MRKPEHGMKISEGQLKRKERLGYVNSPEARKKMSETAKKRTGEKTSMYGKHHSKETRKKMSERSKGKKKKPFSKEHRKNLSKAQQKRKKRDGYMLSPETKKKLSIANSGENSNWWNPNRSEVYAPYGVNFYDKTLRIEKWNLQNESDMLTGTKLDLNKRPAYHHIDYCKSNDDPDNHCFVSNSNHARITNCRNNLIKSEKYKRILQENTQDLQNGLIPRHWSQINKETFRQEKSKQLDLISCVI